MPPTSPSAGVLAIRSSSSRRRRWAAMTSGPYSTNEPSSTRSATFSRAVRRPRARRLGDGVRPRLVEPDAVALDRPRRGRRATAPAPAAGSTSTVDRLPVGASTRLVDRLEAHEEVARHHGRADRRRRARRPAPASSATTSWCIFIDSMRQQHRAGADDVAGGDLERRRWCPAAGSERRSMPSTRRRASVTATDRRPVEHAQRGRSRKYSAVRSRPVAQRRSSAPSRAARGRRVRSGWRCVGSSTGSGSYVIVRRRAGDLEGQLGELADRELVGVADVDRAGDVGVEQGEEAADLVVDVAERRGSGCRRRRS